MAAAFPARVVTPERVLLEQEVLSVMLRTASGDITFLGGHSPLIGAVEPGLVRIQVDGGQEERLAVHGGFVQVDGQELTLLAPIAELAGEIDLERARQALQAADERLAELRGGGRVGEEVEHADRELLAAEEDRRRAQVRIEVAEGA